MDRKTIRLTVKIGQVREIDRAHGDNLGSITTSNGPPINVFPNPQNRLSPVWQPRSIRKAQRRDRVEDSGSMRECGAYESSAFK